MAEEFKPLDEIFLSIQQQLKTYDGLIVSGNAEKIEVKGTKTVMQGKQQVDGHYFASLLTKPKDIRFYYFPIYTHKEAFSLSPALQNQLKGKSCFHLKKVDEDLLTEIKDMLSKGVDLYKKDQLI